MKNTLVFLTFLASVAAAETITYTPLTSSVGWSEFGHARTNKTKVPSLNVTQSMLTMTDSDWSCGYAVYDFAENIVLRDEADTLSVTFTLSSSLVASVVTGALISTDRTIVMGHGAYNGTQDTNSGNLISTINGFQVGDTTTISNGSYNLHQSSTPGTYVERDYTSENGVFTPNEEYTFTTSVEWDTTKSQFVADVKLGNTSLISYNLGESYTLDKLIFSMDCGATGTQKVSGVSVVANIVPEPTTATLSLLALAGLVARRRRR